MTRYRYLNRNRYFLAYDALLIVLAAPLAFFIRLDFSPALVHSLPLLFTFILAGLLVKLPVFHAFGLYRHYWRYASIAELRLIATAVTVSSLALTVLFVAILLPYDVLPTFPRSVLLIDWLLMLLLIGGVRMLARLVAENSGGGTSTQPLSKPKRLLIAGAGDAGTMIVREMQHNHRMSLVPVAFVDDALDKMGKHIRNVPVLGEMQDLPALVKSHRIDEVIIAIPSAPGKTIRQLARLCETAGVPSRIIPGMYELLDGQVSLNQLRQVDIEDLLRRDPITTNTAAVEKLLHGKRVLVTGGGGSIGRELCRQVLRCHPSELMLLGHGENSVFEAHKELLEQLKATPPAGSDPLPLPGGFLPPPIPTLHAVIADVRFAGRINSIFEQYQPEVVFHAAAHKHVPLMEHNPAEAITNNVIGTYNLLQAALANGVAHFVMISTDKAVNPTNVMGASKRAAELLVHYTARHSGKAYVAVRFGNVLGSRGSVVPTFKQQITRGGPVTVTHPEMLRYFMSIPEAVQLVLQAAVLGRGGEVFVLDMGEPVRIMDLARDLIQLSGLEVGRDIDIQVTGLRPGEKLFEELFISGEDFERTEHRKIFIARNAGSLVPQDLPRQLHQLEEAAHQNDRLAIINALKALVPEFQPDQAKGRSHAPASPPPTAAEVLPPDNFKLT
jgi:FlaA1/EpsC-like NDP-sugar epimerase